MMNQVFHKMSEQHNLMYDHTLLTPRHWPGLLLTLLVFKFHSFQAFKKPVVLLSYWKECRNKSKIHYTMQLQNSFYFLPTHVLNASYINIKHSVTQIPEYIPNVCFWIWKVCDICAAMWNMLVFQMCMQHGIWYYATCCHEWCLLWSGVCVMWNFGFSSAQWRNIYSRHYGICVVCPLRSNIGHILYFFFQNVELVQNYFEHVLESLFCLHIATL